MNRIVQKFIDLKKQGELAFMPFLVAGDPNFQTNLKIFKALIMDADLLEIGFPYSDPLADGPVIQAADQRALESGMTTKRVFDLIREIRKFSNVPITILAYANLVYQQGLDNFYAKAKRAGADGVLVPDVPLEEALPFVRAAKRNKIDPIFLITPTTSLDRLKIILKYARGYLYLVSVLGVTGTRKSFSPKSLKFVKLIKTHSSLPVSVGFGISSAAQIKQMAKAGADGVIVGSAIIKIIEQHLGKKDINAKVNKFIRQIKYGN